MFDVVSISISHIQKLFWYRLICVWMLGIELNALLSRCSSMGSSVFGDWGQSLCYAAMAGLQLLDLSHPSVSTS